MTHASVARLLLAAALFASGRCAHAQEQEQQEQQKHEEQAQQKSQEQTQEQAQEKAKPQVQPADAAKDKTPPKKDDAEPSPDDEPERPVPKLVRAPEPPPPPEPSRQAGPDEVAPGDEDGNPYLVSKLVLEYAQEHPENPPVAELLKLRVALTEVPEGYVAPRRGCPVVIRTIGELGSGGAAGKPEFLYGSALRAIGQTVVREMSRRGLIVVFVEPHPDDIDALSETQDDLRLHPDKDPMRLVVRLGAVKQIRTVAAGDRKLKGDRVNNPAHAFIRERSPLREPAGTKPEPSRPIRTPEEIREAIKAADQKRAEAKTDDSPPAAEKPQPTPAEATRAEAKPAEPSTPKPEADSSPNAGPAAEATPARGSLIRRDKLDDFVARLNRHPGRRVDVAVAPADADSPGDVLVDYLVNENNPWTFYSQLSNTGTENTDPWRERLGFSNTQLTGNDDILRLDFITAGFEDTMALIGSYEFPIFSDTLRGRMYGSASKYKASDVGLGGENFKGKGWTAGFEGIWNFYQRRDFFLDAVVGFRAQRVNVRNEVLYTSGDAVFFLPYFGVRANRDTEASSFWGAATLETTVGNPSPDEVANLGRADADSNWTVLQYDTGTSFYLEPLFAPNAQTTESGATLAHELAFSAHGQWAFGNRLIPNAEDIAGGMSTVRGYPESLVAGDSTLIGTAEYRFHLPRAMGVEPDPTKTPLFGAPFRARPQQAYGQADWDLILKGFLDAARVVNSDRKPFESNETLVGTGVGAELQLWRNFSMRVDWGIALTEVEGGETVTSGSNRVHFSMTLMF